MVELWRTLRETECEEGEQLLMRTLHSGADFRVYAAVRCDSGNAVILLDLPMVVLEKLTLPQATRRINVERVSDGGLFDGRGGLLLELREAEYEDLFERMAQDVLSMTGAANSGSAAATACIAVMERWRRFLARKSPRMNPSEVMGLIGELSVLERLAGRIGTEAALDAWVSPDGAIRDFETHDATLEVKSYAGSLGVEVRINDPVQLEAEEGVPLHLVCVSLGRSEEESDRLRGHVERLRRRFSESEAEILEARLAAAGWIDGQDDLYPGGWRTGVMACYQVGPGFPRIRTVEVPAGVLNVRFSIPLNAISQFLVEEGEVVGPEPAPLDY